MTLFQLYEADPCPKCKSEDLKLWHSHYCQAFFVICNNCGHEDGREPTEAKAIDVWNREARILVQNTSPDSSNVTEELTDRDYLFDLANRIFAIPVKHGVDQGDYDRLRSIAGELK